MGVHHGFLGLAVVGTRWGNLAMAMIFGSGVAYFYRLILSVLLLCSFGSVSAYVPAVETPRWFTSGGVLLGGVDPVLAWKARIDGLYGPGKNPACGDIFLVSGVQKVNCTSTYMSDTLTNNPISACPENSSGGVTTCSCNTGYGESGSVCVGVAVATCDSLNSTNAVITASSVGTVGLSTCYNGVTVKASGASFGIKNGVKSPGDFFGPFTCGAPCTGVVDGGSAADPVAPPVGTQEPGAQDCTKTQYWGTVNGISTCVDGVTNVGSGGSSGATAPAGSASGPSSRLGPSAPPTATDSTTETTCTAGICSTVTRYTDATGANVGTSTDTKPQSSFCAENPSSSMCVQSSVSSSPCGSPDACSGDAVQCAIQAQAKITACKLTDALIPDPDASAVGASALGGADGLNTDAMKAAAAASAVNVGAFDASGRGWSRTCPSDPVFEIPFGTVTSWTMPISRICSPLEILANFGVGITLLASLIWVIGGRKT